ncbi:hypothetical protein RchiOBHm_Chr3g0463461 [Rosa chinensis]|uniref:Transmembrane protein n=1 Tax=Rosa chinensis TaxID=74649 RepID=A0A2P6R970_ROSCH|nr:hypothetical protein RchiOBHm_Chr3g0463461 [Rosa chinensis]
MGQRFGGWYTAKVAPFFVFSFFSIFLHVLFLSSFAFQIVVPPPPPVLLFLSSLFLHVLIIIMPFFFFFFLFLLFREKLLLFVFFFDFLFFSPDLARLLLFSVTPLFFLLLPFSRPALSENGAAAAVEWKARFDRRCCRLGFVGGNGDEKNSRVQYGLGRRRIRAAIR